MYSQEQVRNLTADTVVDAAAIGRSGEVCLVLSLGAWFKYEVDGAAVVDGLTVLTARGIDGRWKITKLEVESGALFEYYQGHQALMPVAENSLVGLAKSDIGGYPSVTIVDSNTTELSFVTVELPATGLTEVYELLVELDPANDRTHSIYVNTPSPYSGQYRFRFDKDQLTTEAPITGTGIVDGEGTLTQIKDNLWKVTLTMTYLNLLVDRSVDIIPALGAIPYPGGDQSNLTGSLKVGSEIVVLPQAVDAGDVVRTVELVTQAAHGFAVTQPVYHNGTSWVAAQGDSSDTVAQAIVTGVPSAGSFEITTHGTATVTGHGLTVGEYYWLDQTASAVVDSVPATGVVQSLLHVRDANTLFVDVGQALLISTADSLDLTLNHISVVLGTPQSIPQGAVTQIEFDTAEGVVGTQMFLKDGGTSTASIYVKKAGLYTIEGQGGISSGSPDIYRQVLVTAGATPVFHSGVSSAFFYTANSRTVYIPGNTEVKMEVAHGDTVRNTESSVGREPRLTITEVPTTVVIAAGSTEVLTVGAVDGDIFQWSAANNRMEPSDLGKYVDLSGGHGVAYTLSGALINSGDLPASTNVAETEAGVVSVGYIQQNQCRHYFANILVDTDSDITFTLLDGYEAIAVMGFGGSNMDTAEVTAGTFILSRNAALNDDSHFSFSFIATPV